MIIVLGSVRTDATSIDEALRLSHEHVARSRSEPGCEAHAVHRDADDPLRLVFVEEWSDREALRAHFELPASRTFAKALGQLAVETPSMRIFEASRIKTP